jgi:hypothetical protein
MTKRQFARHYCRNPRCRSKLADPVDNERRAFCTPGCHTTFYRNRCVVCEKALLKGPANRKTCKRASCRNEYQRFPHLFAVAKRNPANDTGNPKRPSKTSIKSGSIWCDREGRGWRWEQYGDEHWFFDRDGDVDARLILIGDRYIVRLTLGIDYGFRARLKTPSGVPSRSLWRAYRWSRSPQSVWRGSMSFRPIRRKLFCRGRRPISPALRL